MSRAPTEILRRRRTTIRARLLVAFVLLVLLPAAAISASSIVLGIENGKKSVFDKLESVAALKETEVRIWLQNLQIDLLGLAGEEVYQKAALLLSGHEEAREAVLSRFTQVTGLTNRYDELFLLSRQGTVVLSTDPVKTNEYRGLQRYFREGLRRPGVHVQSVSYSSASERLNSVIVVHPVVDGRGEAVGVVCGQAKLGALVALMAERTGLGDSGETYLVGPNHVLMTVSRFGGFTPGMTAIGTEGADAALARRENGRAIYLDYRGVPVIGLYHWLPDLGAALLSEQDQEEAFRPIYATLMVNVIVAVAALLFAGLAALLFARSIASPLAALADTASRIAEGNLELHAQVQAPDEIGALARAFNSMTARLRRRIDAARLLAGVSRRFIDLPAQETDRAIEQVLEEIGRFLEVDRSFVFLFSEDRTTVSNSHEWCGGGMQRRAPELQGLRVDSLPWYFEMLRKLDVVDVPSVADLPPEAPAEKARWKSNGVQSLISVPMVYGGVLRGYVGLNSIRETRSWSAEDRQLLRVVGEIVCSALERKWFESALAAQKERLTVTLRSIGDGVITTDTAGKVAMMNQVAEALTGWAQEEAVGRLLSEVFVILSERTRERPRSPVEKVLECGAIVGLANDTVLVHRSGTERIIADSGAPIRDGQGGVIGVVLVFRDVTEKRMLEKERARAEKLESIGILAGGIAHDYNNILTAIMGNLSLARLYAEQDPRLVPLLDMAEKAAKVAEGLTHQLLTFSKGGEPVKKTISIAELVSDAITFALRGSSVRARLAFAKDLWPVEVDRGQISQVLNNLAINAKQAMPGGGVLDVEVGNVLLESENQHGLPAGRYVRIALRDAGTGIPEEHLPKIFDPYFTTKPGGSGLGLATSYAIVKKHNGMIGVRSTVGVGTTFEVHLPVPERASLEAASADRDVYRGSGSILVVDDDESIRRTLHKILGYLGYSVASAPEGSEALRMYAEAMESERPFDLVIMDLTIPGGMGGKEAIQALRKLDPHVRAIVSSGYSNDPVMSNFREHGFVGVALKPYEVAELSEQIKKVLVG